MADKNKNATATIHGVVPETLLAQFLQHVRDFERDYPEDVHLGIAVSAPTMTVAEITDMLKGITPTFPFIVNMEQS